MIQLGKFKLARGLSHRDRDRDSAGSRPFRPRTDTEKSAMSSKASKESLLPKKESNWRHHYVNGTPFTIAMATFALVTVGAVVSGAAMLVSGSAKEAQELLPPVSQSLHSNVYGAKHEGVGFANYVVGNAVAKFWKQNVKALPEDPFAGALGVQKKGSLLKKVATADQGDDSSDADQIKSAQDAAAKHVMRAKRQALNVRTPSARTSTAGNR